MVSRPAVVKATTLVEGERSGPLQRLRVHGDFAFQMGNEDKAFHSSNSEFGSTRAGTTRKEATRKEGSYVQYVEPDDPLFFGHELERDLQMMSMSMPCETPPPFNDKSTQKTIHVIMNLQTGEFFDLFVIGMLLQTLTLPAVELVVKSAQGDTIAQSRLVRDAMEQNTTAIITVDGDEAVMCDAIADAIVEKGIPVVSFDFGGGSCVSEHLLTFQLDDSIARLVLDELVKRHANDAASPPKVGYVTDLNFRPLVNRDKVWQEFKATYGWDEVFTINDAASYESEEELQETILNALLEAEIDLSIEGYPDVVDFIYAPWDYAAIQSLAASRATGSSVHIYGADINDEDIVSMTDPPGGPWKATAGGDPAMIGAAVLRMSLLKVTGELQGTESITLPSFLFTQDFLLNNTVSTLDELRQAMPEFQLQDIAQSCWIDNIAEKI
jgi:ABC-type sugar transport system substrate-binding protein